jgi:hypothetical protein
MAAGEGRSNSVALTCDAPDTSGWRGASQTLALNRTNVVPITVRGWSRAENVSGGTDSDYSLYVDIIYTDGTPLWGQTGDFQCGTHDWELQEFTIVPEKPIRTLSLYCLLRGGHSGKVRFDDVAVEELRTSGTTLLFQGIPMELVSATNPPPAATSVVATSDGLRLGLAGQRVVSLEVDGRDLTAPVAGGFLARDVAADLHLEMLKAGAVVRLEEVIEDLAAIGLRVIDEQARRRAGAEAPDALEDGSFLGAIERDRDGLGQGGQTGEDEGGEPPDPRGLQVQARVHRSVARLHFDHRFIAATIGGHRSRSGIFAAPQVVHRCPSIRGPRCF